MVKRLHELFQLESNTKDCAVFTIKSETSPLDLVKLGGFEGHECMFRMSKDPGTTCITVFRDGDEPYHMSYGSSTTLVDEARRKVRDLIMECVNLDFGIVTGGRSVRAKCEFERLVGETCGARESGSRWEFEYSSTPGGEGVLFVNGQYVAHIRDGRLESWLGERGIRMKSGACRKPSGGGRAVIGGALERFPDELG